MVTSEEIAIVHRDTADQIPKTIEQTLIKHLNLYGRRLNQLHQDVLNTSSQHAAIMQEVVRYPIIATRMHWPGDFANQVPDT